MKGAKPVCPPKGKQRDSIIKRLARRYGTRCWLCGDEMIMEASNNPRSRSIDHVIERRNGGTNDIDNLRLACRECNSARDQLRRLPDSPEPKTVDARVWQLANQRTLPPGLA